MAELDELIERVRRATGGRYDVDGRPRRAPRVGQPLDVSRWVELRGTRASDRAHVTLIVLAETDLVASGQSLESVAEAARRAMRLEHPFILSPTDVIEADELVIVVRPFVAGTTLDRLERGAGLSRGDVRWVLVRLATALEYAHGQGVVHGQVAAESAIVDELGSVLLSNFGIGRTPNASPELDQRALGELGQRLLEDAQTSMQFFSTPGSRSVNERPLDATVARLRSTADSERFATMSDVKAALSNGFDPRDPALGGSLRAAVAREVSKDSTAAPHADSGWEPTPRSAARAPDAPPTPSPMFDVFSAPAPQSLTATGSPIAAFFAPEPLNLSEPVEGLESPSAPAATPTTVPIVDQNVQFTAYRPSVVRPAQWYDMLAFAHLSAAPVGSNEPDPIAAVKAQAKQLLGSQVAQFQPIVQDASQAIPRDGTITFVPTIEGVEFNPPRQSIQWVESVHHASFRLRANAALDGAVARGHMTVLLGAIIVADLTLSIRVDSTYQAAAAADVGEPVQARPYRKIFASYSHRDAEIVGQFERYVSATGDRYLIDTKDLRSGEVWTDRLEELIRDADIVQLFWSSNSMRSDFVRREWEYALSLSRANFVRPTYWEEPLPATEDGTLPPETLRRLQFQLLSHGTEPVPGPSRPSPINLRVESPRSAASRPPDPASAQAPSKPQPRAKTRAHFWRRTSLASAAAVVIAAVGFSVLSRTYSSPGPLENPLPVPATNPTAVQSVQAVAEAYRTNEGAARQNFSQQIITLDSATVVASAAPTSVAAERDLVRPVIVSGTSRPLAHVTVLMNDSLRQQLARTGGRAGGWTCRVDPKSKADTVKIRDCRPPSAMKADSGVAKTTVAPAAINPALTKVAPHIIPPASNIVVSPNVNHVITKRPPRP